MTGTIHTYTVLHIGAGDAGEEPYAVVVAELDGELHSARTDGDLSWLSIGAPVRVSDGQASPG